MKKILFILLILNFGRIFSFELSRYSSLCSSNSSSTMSTSSSSSSNISMLNSSTSSDPFEKYLIKKEEIKKHLLMKVRKDLLSIIIGYLPDCVSREQWNKNGRELILTANRGNIQEVRKLLESGEVDVNAKNDYGSTVLMGAVLFNGHLKIVKLLLEHNADVNAKNNLGFTALIRASSWGNLEIVKLLLEYNADVNAKNYLGSTALMVASQNGQEDIVNLLKAYGATE